MILITYIYLRINVIISVVYDLKNKINNNK